MLLSILFAMELMLYPFFLFLSLCMYVAAEPASQCLRSGPEVRFPFRLIDQNQPGYPGFDLSCNTNNETIIHLQSASFIVREIDYIAQQIRINDPDFTCLPEKILSLNLSGTPFRGAFYQEFSFFSCSPGPRRPELQPISCLSNSTRSIFATSSSPTVRSDLFGSCDLVKTVSVPVRSPGFGEVPSSSLDQDLVLQWDLPGCRDCEAQGGRCGLKNSSGLEIDCLVDHQEQSRSRHCRGLIWYFALGFIMACFREYCFTQACDCDDSDSNSEEPDPIVPYHPEVSLVRALEHITIESGPKSELEIGDSGRLPNPDEPICPICLSGFKPREIPKALHPCQHSFHARCIDTWLLLNPTCPLCRAVSQQITVAVM